MDELTFKLQQLQIQNSQIGGGLNTGNNGNVEAVLNAAKELTDKLEVDVEQLAGATSSLILRVSDIWTSCDVMRNLYPACDVLQTRKSGCRTV